MVESIRPSGSETAHAPYMRDFPRIVLFALAYFSAHHVSFLFPDTEEILMAVWPAGGIGLAAFLLTPRSRWPVVMAALFVAGNAANLSVGRPLLNSLGFMTANVIESLGSALLITRMCGNRVRFTRVVEIVALVSAATVVNAFTSLVGAGTAAYARLAPFWSFWKTWWVADGLGILLVTPLIVTWDIARIISFRPRWGRVIEWCLFFSLWCVTANLVFQTRTTHGLFIPYPYVLFALLAWAALRFGQRNLSLSLCVLAAIAVTSEAVSSGPLLWGGATRPERLILAQLFLGVIAVTGFLLAASYSEAKSSELLAREEQDRLRALGDNLPNGMIYQVAVEGGNSRRFLYVSAAVERINGVSAEAVLGDPGALYSLIEEEDRPVIAAAEEEAIRNFSTLSAIVRMRRTDGRLRWMHLSSSPRRTADGGIVFDGIQLDVTDRKLAEEKILKSESRLRESQEVARIGSWSWDVVNGALEWSDVAFRLFDRDPATFIPTVEYFVSLIHPEDRDVVRNGIEDSLANDAPYHIQPRIRNESGREWVLEGFGRVERDAAGKPLRFAGTVQDITERKRAEETALERGRFIESMVNLSPDILYIYDVVERRNVYSNEGISLVLGYSPEEVLAMGDRMLPELMHPDCFRRYIEETYPRYGRAGDKELITHGFRMRHKSGEWHWLDCTEIVYLREADGSPRQIFGVAHDITGRVLAEEKLRQSEEYVRDILDTVDEGFIVIDREYRILTANKAYLSLVPFTGGDVVGKHCYEVSHRSERPCFLEGEECPAREAFATGEPRKSVHRHTGSDGEALFVETKAFPNRNEAGDVVSVIETIANITERHLLEEERLKTQKLESIGTLAGGIAHDFNNLLQGVFGHISMARMSIDRKEESLAMLEEAEEALHRTVSLTNQLLTFAKGGKPVKRPLFVLPVVESAARFALSGSSCEYEISGQGDLWQVNGDAGQIGQVVQNISLNADQSMPHGGAIKITARNVPAGAGKPKVLQEGDYVSITVGDSGIGIPENYLERIFDPYFTTKERGSGLGLATSYSIVRNHGGIIDVESRPGEGTTFTIYLPAIREKAPEPEQGVSPAGSRSARVLVMDDEELVRKISGKLLRALGHECEFAERGESAVAMYRAARDEGRPFDLVVLDLTIRGGMGGVETLRELLAIDPGVKAVVSSGYSDDTALSEYRSQGFRLFLKKPYDLEELRDAVNSLLA